MVLYYFLTPSGSFCFLIKKLNLFTLSNKRYALLLFFPFHLCLLYILLCSFFSFLFSFLIFVDSVWWLLIPNSSLYLVLVFLMFFSLWIFHLSNNNDLNFISLLAYICKSSLFHKNASSFYFPQLTIIEYFAEVKHDFFYCSKI